MGESVRFKALVGLSSLAADEKAVQSNSYKGHWFARDNWPAPSEDTGLLPIAILFTPVFYVTLYLVSVILNLLDFCLAASLDQCAYLRVGVGWQYICL